MAEATPNLPAPELQWLHKPGSREVAFVHPGWSWMFLILLCRRQEFMPQYQLLELFEKALKKPKGILGQISALR